MPVSEASAEARVELLKVRNTDLRSRWYNHILALSNFTPRYPLETRHPQNSVCSEASKTELGPDSACKSRSRVKVVNNEAPTLGAMSNTAGEPMSGVNTIDYRSRSRLAETGTIDSHKFELNDKPPNRKVPAAGSLFDASTINIDYTIQVVKNSEPLDPKKLKGKQKSVYFFMEQAVRRQRASAAQLDRFLGLLNQPEVFEGAAEVIPELRLDQSHEMHESNKLITRILVETKSQRPPIPADEQLTTSGAKAQPSQDSPKIEYPPSASILEKGKELLPVKEEFFRPTQIEELKIPVKKPFDDIEMSATLYFAAAIFWKEHESGLEKTEDLGMGRCLEESVAHAGGRERMSKLKRQVDRLPKHMLEGLVISEVKKSPEKCNERFLLARKEIEDNEMFSSH